MIPADIEVTQHAIDRFVERSLKLGFIKPVDPKRTILELLGAAKPASEEFSAFKVQRLLKHNFKEAEYYETEGWRFVLSADHKTLLTVERVEKSQN